jgi:CTP synthase
LPVIADLQFHPEFKSRPGRASPLFLGFILASGKRLNSYLTSRATPQPSPMSTPIKPSPQQSMQLGMDSLSLSPAANGAPAAAAAAAGGKEGGSGAQAALFMSG